METIAFRMQIKPGAAAEYQRRHDAIWPELAALLRESGVRDYRIFLDPATGALFAVLSRTPDHRMDRLAEQPVMQRWWAHMADIMDSHPDGAPVVTPLSQVFHLP
jgi:L-rhamnose mutarotase